MDEAAGFYRTAVGYTAASPPRRLMNVLLQVYSAEAGNPCQTFPILCCFLAREHFARAGCLFHRLDAASFICTLHPEHQNVFVPRAGYSLFIACEFMQLQLFLLFVVVDSFHFQFFFFMLSFSFVLIISLLYHSNNCLSFYLFPFRLRGVPNNDRELYRCQLRP